jgi:phage terminase small subunit
MARPRKPISILKLQGTHRKDRHATEDLPFSAAADIANPFDKEKQKDEAEHWDALAPDFIRLGLMNQVNKQTIVHLCQVHRDILACEKKIADEGLWVMTPVFSRKTGEQTGEIETENLAVRLLRDLRYQYEKLLNEFGGNPSAAAKVAAQKKPEKSTQPGDSFAAKFMSFPKASGLKN